MTIFVLGLFCLASVLVAGAIGSFHPIGTGMSVVKGSCNIVVEAAEGHVGIWRYRMHSALGEHHQFEFDSWGIQIMRVPHVDHPKDPDKNLDLFYFIAPFWMVSLCLLIPPAAAILLDRYIFRTRRWRAQNRCVQCGYSLTGNETGTCPECGHSFQEPSDESYDE